MNSSRCRVIPVDWRQPLIVWVAGWLADNAATLAGESPPLVVLPSSHAINRLQWHVHQQPSGPSIWSRLDVVTTGELSSRLTGPTRDAATELEQSLAWAKTLSGGDPERLQTLLPRLPPPDALAAWLELGGTMRRLHSSLAAENISFSLAAEHASTDGEKARWDLLLQLRDDYLNELERADRIDLNEAALAGETSSARGPVVLVNVVDLSPLSRRLLLAAQASGTPITAITASPDGRGDGLDEFGALRPADWLDHAIPLTDDHLVPADGVNDQAVAAWQFVGAAVANQTDGENGRLNVTIGVTDESQVQPIVNQLRLRGASSHRFLGYAIRETAIGRLMDLIVAHAQRRTWRTLAALVRHADVHRMISARPDAIPANWMTQLDQLLGEAFPRSVDGPLPGGRPQALAATAIGQCIDAWLKPLLGVRRPIGLWCDVVSGMLSDLYRTESDDSAPAPDSTTVNSNVDASKAANADRTTRALAVVQRMLGQFSTLSESLDLSVDGPVAMEMLSARLADVRLAEPRVARSVEILGWLDLVLDDSPHVVICGLNHPFVPEAVSGDPFVPQTLRKALLQKANDRRYARDVHGLHQMLASREQLRLIVGKHAADGSPTPPSRLLAAGSAAESAHRVCRLLTTTRTGESASSAVTGQSVESFYAPPPVERGRTVKVLSVTAFSAYLACPYRFYLRHVLRLRPLDDSAMELAANQFGDLVHGALEWFGQSDAKDERDVDVITDAMVTQLHRYAGENYGDNTSTTVRLQVRQAERRLRTVAQRQAERIAAGWHIHAVEASVDELDRDGETGQPKTPTGLIVDGEFMGLRGRFDRIDHHPESGRWAILDYKTHGHQPEKKHLKKLADGSTTWVDLQLPLYRRFIPDLGIPADPVDVELGYFNVAEKDTETKINLASFTPTQFAQADALIVECVRQIQRGRFEPNPNGVDFDDYAWMMNERTWGPPIDENEDDDVEVSS